MLLRGARSCLFAAGMLVVSACGPPSARGVRPRVVVAPVPRAAAQAAARSPHDLVRGAPSPPAPSPAGPGDGAPPSLSAAWGTADPLTFVEAAPDRRWIVVCQARHDTNGDGAVRVDVAADGALSGDSLDGYFLDAPGPGVPIDSFVGADPTGRFVAFVREGRVVLRDTKGGVDTDLAADPRDDLGPYVHGRAVAFDPTGRRMLYLQKPEFGGKIIVRDLATGTETVIDPGDGALFRADFGPSGDTVIAKVVVADTNGNGRLDWPVREAKKPFMRCAPPLPRFAVWERHGDEVTLRVARATGGVARDVPGLVAPTGDAFIVRDPDGALTRVGPDGKRTPLARKSCDAHLLHVDAGRGLTLLTCLDAKKKIEVVLVGEGPAKRFGLTLSVAVGDHWLEGEPRLVPLQPGSDAALLDLEHRQVEMLQPHDRILATSGTRALVLRHDSLVLHELFGAERVLGGKLVPLLHMEHAGTVYYVPPFIVDVSSGKLLGLARERALAVATDGALLVSEGGAADATHFARGPLRWKAPEETPVADGALVHSGP